MYMMLAAILTAPVIFVRFESAFNFDQLSVIRREELAETAFAMITNSPWFGVGLNNYIPTASSGSFLSGTNRFLQPVHNIFLLVLSESGVVGLVGFLVLLFSPLFLYKVGNLLSRSQVILLLLVLVFLGMLDHYFLTLAQGQRVLFMIWGLSLCRKSGSNSLQ